MPDTKNIRPCPAVRTDVDLRKEVELIGREFFPDVTSRKRCARGCDRSAAERGTRHDGVQGASARRHLKAKSTDR